MRAREFFQQGAELARQYRWRDAVEAFEQSAQLRPHAGTSYNLGFSERALGRSTRAWRRLSTALAQHAASGSTELTAEVAAEAKRYLDEVEVRIVKVQVTVEPVCALLAVNGRPLERVSRPDSRPVFLAGTRDAGAAERPPASFELWLDPGTHVIVISRPGVPAQATSESFAAGSRRTLVLKLAAPASAPARSPSVVPPPPTTRSDTHARRLWSLVLTGVGVAALATGTGLGLWARSTWSDAKAACPSRTVCPNDRGHTLSRDTERQGNAATAMFVVGGAALVSAAAVWFLWRPGGTETRRLSLLPTLGPGAAALTLTGSYR